MTEISEIIVNGETYIKTVTNSGHIITELKMNKDQQKILDTIKAEAMAERKSISSLSEEVKALRVEVEELKKNKEIGR